MLGTVSMKNKYFLLTVLLAILFFLTLLIFATIYFRSHPAQIKTNDSLTPVERSNTLDWKTYTNASEKFSFKYPSDFVESKSWRQNQVTFVNDQYTLITSVDEKSEGLSLWIADIQKSLKNHEPNVAEKHTWNSLQNSYDAYLESRMSAEGTFERNVFIITKDGLITFRLSADTTLPGNEEPEVYTNVEELMDQILLTIEFGK